MKSSLFNIFTRSRSISIWAFFTALVIFFLINVQAVLPSTTSDLNNVHTTVIEYLRLSVSKEDREAWLAAEKKSWEPWLKKQKGFVKREIFWDPKNEEALLLISWASRSDWKNIPQSEIDKVQIAFEKLAMNLTNKDFINPFPIKSQGEFLPQ